MKVLDSCKYIARLIWGDSYYGRVVTLASIFLVYLSSIGSTLIPLLFKQIVDLLQIYPVNHSLFISLPFLVFLSYGLGWSLNQGLDALRTFLAFNRISKILTIALSDTLDKLICMPFSFHINKKTGSIISIFNRMEAGLPTLIYSTLIQVIPLIIQILLAVGVVIYMFGVTYGVLVLATISIYIIFTINTTQKNIRFQLKCNQQENLFSDYMLDVLQHYDTVKYFNNESFEKQQLYDLLKKKEFATIAMYKRMGIINFIQVIIIGLGLTLITLKSGYDVLHHRISLGSFVLLNTYTLQFSIPMSNIGYVLLNIKRSFIDMQAFQELVEAMDISPATKPQLIINNPDIAFKNVTYYTDTQKKILNDVSFILPYGKTIAIMGKTGAGKSTIIKLLLGLLKPNSGEIFIGGHNIQDIPINTLINTFGVVPQDSALFNRTVRENISYGNLHAAKGEVSSVIKSLELQDLENGSLTGERAARISGGEKQRVAIGRLFLKRPAICIFDEFTSSLDEETEKKIINHVYTLFQQQTKIIISHKKATLKNADIIINLANGKITTEHQFA